jgi:hypothetical protein
MSTVNFSLLQKPNNIQPLTYRSHLPDRRNERAYKLSASTTCANITDC